MSLDLCYVISSRQESKSTEFVSCNLILRDTCVTLIWNTSLLVDGALQAS